MNNRIPDDMSPVYAAAEECFLAGRLEEAARICNEIIAVRPDHFDALHLLGGIALRTGNPYRGAELLGRSIRVQPGAAVAHMNLGRARYLQGKLPEAAASFRRAVKLQKDLADARQLLETVSTEIRRLDQAVAVLDRSGQAPSIRFSRDEQEQRCPSPATLNLAVRLYRHFGYLVIEDLFTEEYVHELHDYFTGEYSDYFADRVFDDALVVGDRRRMVTVKLGGLFNDPAFYANPLVMPLLIRLLGRDLILYSLGAVISLPGALVQRTHRDHLPLFEGDDVDAVLPSFAVTLGVPLIEMNEVNGTTRFYGKTHLQQEELSEQERDGGISPVIRRGSCVLFDYRVFHEGTPNQSTKVRPLMYNIYTRPWFRDIQNYSKQSPLSVPEDELPDIPDAYRRLLLRSRRS